MSSHIVNEKQLRVLREDIVMSCLMACVKNLAIFGAGMYTGMIIMDKCQIESVDTPSELFHKAKAKVADFQAGCVKKKKEDSGKKNE